MVFFSKNIELVPFLSFFSPKNIELQRSRTCLNTIYSSTRVHNRFLNHIDMYLIFWNLILLVFNSSNQFSPK